MTRRVRIFLICILILSFFLITPVLILYSQGYRFDLNPPEGGIKITQTGGLFLKVAPKSADIFLDGKINKKTSFFFESAYIDNLLPRKYNIRIEKDGYEPWEKTLEIKEKQVTEAKNILLIPKELEIKNLSKEVEDFWVLSGGKIVLKEYSLFDSGEGNKISQDKEQQKEWALKIFNLENNLKSHLIGEREISQKQPELMDLKFSPDSQKILLQLGLKEQLQYFILDLKQNPLKLIQLDFLEPDVEKVNFHPQNPDIVFYFSNGNLFEFDPIKPVENRSRRVKEKILTYQIFNNNIYYINQSGYIFKNNLSFTFEEKINNSPFLLKQETKYELKAVNNFIFVLEEKKLYIFNSETKEFEKIFEPVKEIKPSPDSKKITYFSDHEIWILFLEEEKEQPKREFLEKDFLIRFSEKINDVFWLNSHYLIFSIENKNPQQDEGRDNKLKVIEIDDRNKTNIYELSLINKYNHSDKLETEKFFWSNIDKRLYFLNQKNLFLSETFLKSR